MITYQGLKVNNKVYYVCFANDDGERVEVPVETKSAERISRYLDKIAKAPKDLVERQEPEEDEEA